MGEINFINYKTAVRKMKNALKFMLVGAGITAGSIVAGRAYNDFELFMNKRKITETIMYQPNEDALEFFSRNYLLPGSRKFLLELKKEAKSYYSKESEGVNYSSLSEIVERARNLRGILEDEEINMLENKLNEIHPEAIMKKADETKLPAERFEMYEKAERAFSELKIDSPGIIKKKGDTLLDLIDSVYEPDKHSEVVKNFYKLNDIMRGNGQVRLDEDKLRRLFDKTPDYVEGLPSHFMFRQLSFLNEEYLNLPERQEILRKSAEIVFTKARREIEANSKKYLEKVRDIKIIQDINSEYGLGRDSEVQDLYVLALENALPTEINGSLETRDILLYSESFPQEIGAKIKIKVAEGLLFTVKEKPLKEAYLDIQTARGLYLDAGVPLGNHRFIFIDEIEKELFSDDKNIIVNKNGVEK